jgi:hypothetical protein
VDTVVGIGDVIYEHYTGDGADNWAHKTLVRQFRGKVLTHRWNSKSNASNAVRIKAIVRMKTGGLL